MASFTLPGVSRLFSDSPRMKALNRRLPGLALLAAVLFLSAELARLTWLVVPGPEPAEPPAASATPASEPGAASEDGPDIASLVSMHLFGEAGEPAPRQQEAIDAPETQLNLTLLGVVASQNPGQSRAIIKGGGEEQSYRIDDQLPGGARLHAVYPDRVILDRRGQLEALRMPRDESGQDLATVEKRGGGNGRGDARQVEAKRIQQQLRRDPEKAIQNLTDIVRIRPQTADGKLQGYRVQPGRERKRFRSTGLQNGDIIKAVNGMQVTDASAGPQVMNMLRDANQITLTVERNGQMQTINISLASQ